jgi:hypothetical protein
MSKTHEFTTFRDWDPANTLDVPGPEFSLDRAPSARTGDGVVVNLVTGVEDRDGVYIGHVDGVNFLTNSFTVELM